MVRGQLLGAGFESHLGTAGEKGMGAGRELLAASLQRRPPCRGVEVENHGLRLLGITLYPEELPCVGTLQPVHPPRILALAQGTQTGGLAVPVASEAPRSLLAASALAHRVTVGRRNSAGENQQLAGDFQDTPFAEESKRESGGDADTTQRVGAATGGHQAAAHQ